MVSRKVTWLVDSCLLSLDMDFCPEVQPAQKREIKYNCISSSTHVSWALVDLFI